MCVWNFSLKLRWNFWISWGVFELLSNCIHLDCWGFPALVFTCIAEVFLHLYSPRLLRFSCSCIHLDCWGFPAVVFTWIAEVFLHLYSPGLLRFSCTCIHLDCWGFPAVVFTWIAEVFLHLYSPVLLRFSCTCIHEKFWVSKIHQILSHKNGQKSKLKNHHPICHLI